jgi:hypothetical protein
MTNCSRLPSGTSTHEARRQEEVNDNYRLSDNYDRKGSINEKMGRCN